MIKKWPIIESTNGPDMGLFRITTNRCRSPRTGEEHDFYSIDFANWVQIIPITPDDQVVMVRQYRHGAGRIFLELPGGLIEGDDLDPVTTARRELLEETGYRADDLILLASTYPQPAAMNHMGFTYVAPDVLRTADPSLDEAEDIEVCLTELERVPDMIRSGEIKHGQAVMALSLYFLLHK